MKQHQGIEYKVYPHWDNFKKFPARIGSLDFRPGELTGKALTEALDEIFFKEQNDNTPRPIPSASVDDVIEIEGKWYVVLNEGFAETHRPVMDHSVGKFEFYCKKGTPHAGELFDTKECTEEYARVYCNTYKLFSKRVELK